MKNTFGTNIAMTLFGESHGEAIGCVLDGLPAGFAIDENKLQAMMDRRKPKGKTGTQRHEADQVHIVSGLFEGRTTGTAMTLLIYNINTRSQDYASIKYRLRPGHADFTAFEKYDGFQDYRGGGHFSGRLTAALVAAGAICTQILEAFGIQTGIHIQSLHHLQDVPFSSDLADMKQQIEMLQTMDFPVLDPEMAITMQKTIEEAAAAKDSVGGIMQGAVIGLPAGIGEPFFDAVESVLSHVLFAIPAVKGVSFGDGFAITHLYGSQANDAFVMDQDRIVTATNHNGGINGGITNGMPLLFQVAVKPTASIFLPQHSVDYQNKENTELTIQGRHDPAIIHRACVVAQAMVNFALLDLWISRLGIASLQQARKGQDGLLHPAFSATEDSASDICENDILEHPNHKEGSAW